MKQYLRNRSWGWLFCSLVMGFIPITIPNIIINTLYTVSGIIFGIGFSLIISSTYKNIRRDDRLELRNNLNNIRERFVFYFTIATITYILSALVEKKSFIVILSQIFPCEKVIDIANSYHLSCSSLCVMIFTILTFVRSYSNLQKLNDSIDDEMTK